MSEIADAVVGFPTVVLTAALVVVIGLWLLVLLGGAERYGFNSGTDVGNRGMFVIADASLVIVLGWVFSLTGSLLLRRTEISGLLYGLLAVTVLAASLALAYIVIRTIVRPDPR